MREILFRGKVINKYVENENRGKWVEGDLVHGVMEHDGMTFIWAKEDHRPLGSYEYPVIPETVGQFTGMLDKNKKKIFEGDIILYANSYLYEVFWSSDELQYRIREVGVGDMDHLSNLFESATEIIGNIHDNPEMLKEN